MVITIIILITRGIPVETTEEILHRFKGQPYWSVHGKFH